MPSSTPNWIGTQANELLDGIGLADADGDGLRDLPSGEPFDIEIQVIPQFGNWPDIAQIIVENWAEVGVKSHIEIRERALGFTMRDTNELMVDMWNEDTTGFPFSGQPKMDVRAYRSGLLAHCIANGTFRMVKKVLNRPMISSSWLTSSTRPKSLDASARSS